MKLGSQATYLSERECLQWSIMVFKEIFSKELSQNHSEGSILKAAQLEHRAILFVGLAAQPKVMEIPHIPQSPISHFSQGPAVKIVRANPHNTRMKGTNIKWICIKKDQCGSHILQIYVYVQNTYMYIHTYMFICMFMYKHVFMCIHTYIHMGLYDSISVNIYIYVTIHT